MKVEYPIRLAYQFFGNAVGGITLKLLDLAKKNLEEYISVIDAISIVAKTQETTIKYVGVFLLNQMFDEEVPTYSCNKYYVLHDDDHNWGKFTNTYQILNEISENEEFEDTFTFHEKNIFTLLASSYWKLSDLYNLKLFRELSIDFYFRLKKIIYLTSNKKLPIEKFEDIDELSIEQVRELLGEDNRTYIQNNTDNFFISEFAESLHRCLSCFDFIDFEMVIKKQNLKKIFFEHGIILSGFNNDLSESLFSIEDTSYTKNIWDQNYLSQLEIENTNAIDSENEKLENLDVTYQDIDYLMMSKVNSEYPLYYKNYTFNVQEVACLLSGYNPISIGSQWEYVHWLKENPKFAEALDFVWSAVRGDIFDAISGNYFVIESEKLKTFLAERKFFIDGFNKHLEPLEKDRMPESNNLILERFEQQIEDMKVQLLEKDEMIKELKANPTNYDLHPSLNPNNSSHAPELLLAIKAWEEKYLEKRYQYHEHTPAIELILKEKGLKSGRLIQRISAITNPKKKI
ncbi:hypothetical protein [Acinetobacter guillouiae]|uniref:hypothetical protein n=1 Tax=Acinetobacter guillouiae TaxID=106649 RepID=UPI003AF774B6